MGRFAGYGGGGCTVESMRSYPSTIELLSYSTKVHSFLYFFTFTQAEGEREGRGIEGVSGGEERMGSGVKRDGKARMSYFFFVAG